MDALEGGSTLGDDVDVPDEDEISAVTAPDPVGFVARLKALFTGGKDVEEVVATPHKNTKGRNRRGQKSKAGKKAGKNILSRSKPLTIEDIPELFPEKSEVHVQVTKGPIGSKGARVTANLSVPGRFLVLLPNSRHIGISKKISDRKERDRLRKIVRGLQVPKGMGLIVRTVADGQTEEMFKRDYRMVISAWKDAQTISRNKKGPVCVYEEPRLVRRTLRDYLNEEVTEIIADTEESCEEARKMVVAMGLEKDVRIRFYKGTVPIFQKFGLSRQIENIFHRKVPLPSGGYICIDETEALIAIDVNTGRSRGGKDHPETILNTNLEAVDEIARQLRIRNLGGLLVLDLIDMRSKDDRRTVQKALRDAFRKDRARTRISPISNLGLVEMTRQREHESLRDTVYSSCPYCKGRGLVKSSKSVSVELQRRLQSILRRGKKRDLRVNVHPQVLDRLRKEDSELLKSLESDFGGQLSFRSDEDLHHEEFVIIDQATGREM